MSRKQLPVAEPVTATVAEPVTAAERASRWEGRRWYGARSPAHAAERPRVPWLPTTERLRPGIDLVLAAPGDTLSRQATSGLTLDAGSRPN